MKTFTITDAKKNLGALLRSALAGEEVGIVCGAEIVGLHRVEVRNAFSYEEALAQEVGAPRIGDAAPGAVRTQGSPAYPVLGTFDGPPDMASRHDEYLYGEKA